VRPRDANALDLALLTRFSKRVSVTTKTQDLDHGAALVAGPPRRDLDDQFVIFVRSIVIFVCRFVVFVPPFDTDTRFEVAVRASIRTSF
jgi:hypothetical protein